MITKKSEYAIRALWELANMTSERTTAAEIAKKQSIPPKYLPQIISELSRAGLINSTRGYGGGLKLSRKASNISLLHIIEAIQGPIRIYECQDGASKCFHLPNCDLRSTYNKAQAALEKVFSESKLSGHKLSNR